MNHRLRYTPGEDEDKDLLYVILETRDPEGNWYPKIDGLRAVVEGDLEDEAIYREAEDILLAAAGLTRDDLAETVECW